jgi:hypothetical protein
MIEYTIRACDKGAESPIARNKGTSSRIGKNPRFASFRVVGYTGRANGPPFVTGIPGHLCAR